MHAWKDDQAAYRGEGGVEKSRKHLLKATIPRKLCPWICSSMSKMEAVPDLSIQKAPGSLTSPNLHKGPVHKGSRMVESMKQFI